MKNTFIVTDTNVFIDLHYVSLLDAFFHLPWDIHTPDYVIEEIKDTEQRTAIMEFANTDMLTVDTQSPDDFIRLAQLINSQNGVSNLSATDCAVWMLAEKLQCPLLTGDAKLRAKAHASNIEVHGILCVLNQLVNHMIIKPEMAAQRLKRLFNKNQRLPEEEILKRVEKWSDKNEKDMKM